MATNLPVVHTSFASTGTLSWSDLGTRAVTFSVDVLSRVAAAGVNPYTIVVGQTLMQNFRLSRQCRKNIGDALQNLQGFYSWSKALWFGFGIRSVIYDLAQTDEGSCLLALCGTLSECFNEEYAAEVLQEMTQTLKLPGQFVPSTREWLAIVHSCSGVFARSDFAVIVGLITAHIHRSRVGQVDFERMPNHRQEPPEPADLAAVLMALGNVSRNRIESVEASGGFRASWIIAIAVWMFGLTVTATTSDGETLYSNCKTAEEPQFLYVVRDYTASQPVLRIASTSYTLRKWDDLFAKASVGADTGRISWEIVLKTTFGSCIDVMNSNTDAMNRMIGCVAASLRTGQLKCPNLKRKRREEGFHKLDMDCYFSLYNLYGKRVDHMADLIVSAITTWFPELVISQVSIKEASSLAANVAHEQFHEHWNSLTAQCFCKHCAVGAAVGAAGDATYCIGMVFLFILQLSLYLDTVEVSKDLLPTWNGLRLAYMNHITKGSYRLQSDKLCAWFNTVLLRSSMVERLQMGIQLFVGRSVGRELLEFRSAVSHGGICFYFRILEGLSLDVVKLSKLCITPGRIERNDKPSLDIKDSHTVDANRLPLDQLTRVQEPLALVVREKNNGLEAWYKLIYANNTLSSARTVQCAEFLSVLSKCRFGNDLYCKRDDCAVIIAEPLYNATGILANIEFEFSRLSIDTPLGPGRGTMPGAFEESGDEDNAAHRHPSERRVFGAAVTRHTGILSIYSGNELGSCGFLYAANREGYNGMVVAEEACLQCCVSTLSVFSYDATRPYRSNEVNPMLKYAIITSQF